MELCKHKCCCNCKALLPLHKHPMNREFGTGSILEECGWICTHPEITEGEFAIFFDKQHDICELYTAKIK